MEQVFYIILIVVLLIITCTCGVKEAFSSCYGKQTVYLRSPGEGKDSGVAIVEKRQGKTTITLNGYLPLAEAGVFTTLQGQYYVKLEGKGQRPLILGRMLRGAYRTYYLTDQLVGNYDKYDNICVYLKTKGHEDRKMLTGKI